MEKINSFTDIINLWHDCEDLGRDINAPGSRVRAWKKRNSIPPEWWNDVARALKKRGKGDISHKKLVELYEKKFKKNKDDQIQNIN